MVEELCRCIYNVGLKLDCNLSKYNCLCPTEKDYELLCYQCYLRQKEESGEVYKLKLNAESGEIKICHEFEYEDPCVSVEWVGYQIVNVIVENVCDKVKKSAKPSHKSINAIIELVALAMTQVISFERGEVSYINMIDAFYTEQFIAHFWNLLCAVMRQFQKGKDNKKLLKELRQCISGINTIYENRREIGEQFGEYLIKICAGLERAGCGLELRHSFLGKQNELINGKMDAETIEEFIFCCIDTDGKFTEYEYLKGMRDEFLTVISVIKKYLINYQEQKNRIDSEIYEQLVSALNLFATEEVNIGSIEELRKIDFQSENSWKANAGVVLQHLQNMRRRNLIEAYEVVFA